MEYLDYERTKQALAEWYARDDNKWLLYYAALGLWVVVATVDTALLAWLATYTADRVSFVAFIFIFYAPLAAATTAALLRMARETTLVEWRRLSLQQQHQGLDDGDNLE